MRAGSKKLAGLASKLALLGIKLDGPYLRDLGAGGGRRGLGWGSGFGYMPGGDEKGPLLAL